MGNLMQKLTPEEVQNMLSENQPPIKKEVMKDPIVEKVIESYNKRSELGIKKYGTTLEKNNDSLYTFLTHLQEELMDATLYIEKLKSKVLELHHLDMKMTEK